MKALRLMIMRERIELQYINECHFCQKIEEVSRLSIDRSHREVFRNFDEAKVLLRIVVVIDMGSEEDEDLSFSGTSSV